MNPNNQDELLLLAGKIIAKHEKDSTGGGTSLLAALPLAESGKPAMADMGAALAAATGQHTLAGDLTKQAEKAYQARDTALGEKVSSPGTVLYYVTAVRDLLLALNKGREKVLGDWGFEVSDSPRVKPASAPAK